MKTKITVFILMVMIFSSYAQETVGGRVAKNAKEKTYHRDEQKGDGTVDKALDKVEEGIGKLFKKKEKKAKKKNTDSTESSEETNQNNGSSSSSSSSNPKNLKLYSKFDFVRVEKIIGFDDFSTTNVGDFPKGWNTN